MLNKIKRAITADPLFGFLCLSAILVLILKSYRLGYQSMWIDEGFYVLAAKKIISHGYPLYPSGHILFKSIFYSYSLALYSLIFGKSIFCLRFFSLLLHALTPLVIYRSARDFIDKKVLLVSGLILYLFTWETEYARSAMYYSLTQLLFTLSILLFMRAKLFQKSGRFAVPWILTGLTHQLGMGLAFSFPAYLLMAPRRFLEKKNLLSLCFWIPFFAFLMFQEVLLWRVGQVYANQQATSTSGIFDYFFKGFQPVYWKLMARSHPLSIKIFFAGLIFIIILILFKKLFRKIPFAPTETSLLFMFITFILCIFSLGLMRTHPMPRYLFPFHYLFIIIVVSILFLIFKYLLKPIIKKEIIFLILLMIVAYLSFHPLSPAALKDIISRDYTDPVNTDVIYTSGRPYPEDHQSIGEYAAAHIRKDDTVIAMNMIFQYLYGGKVDYWLFTGGPGTWDAWEKVGDTWHDVYLGIPWINSLAKLKEIINNRLDQNQRVWIITSTSQARAEHISQDIQDFLKENDNKVQWLARDGIGKAYLFSPENRNSNAPFLIQAEWGIYPTKNRTTIDQEPCIRLDRKHWYKTPLLFNQSGSVRLVFKKFSPASLVELQIIEEGKVVLKRFFSTTKNEKKIKLNLKISQPAYMGLRIKQGSDMYLDYFIIDNP